MLSFFSEILQPINCVLTSEDVPAITIVLSERRQNSLKGKIFNNNQIKGNFYTRRPTKDKPANWSFKSSNLNINGEIILFKDQELWHRYQNEIKANQVNRVLFSNLSFKLSKIIDDEDLLRGTSGFFKIGSQCNGGKIKKASHKNKKYLIAII